MKLNVTKRGGYTSSSSAALTQSRIWIVLAAPDERSSFGCVTRAFAYPATMMTPPIFPRLRVKSGIVLLAASLNFLGAFFVASATENVSTPTGVEIFGPTQLHRFYLQISAKEYAAMQPPPNDSDDRAPTPAPNANPTAIKDSHRSGGNDFPWVHAELMAGKTTYTNVAVRYKGHFTYGATSHLLKRSLKIDLVHYGEKSRFGSLKKLTLNAGILDPGKSREALAYAVYRDAGVPAPRTAFAEVYLTVPGRYNGELLGLFTLVEDIEDSFLQDHFGEENGLLMKPEGVRGPDFLGMDWRDYVARYKPVREASTEQSDLLIALARLIDQSKPEEFREKIESYLNVDEFLRYLAVTAMVVDLDSPLAMPQNFYLYLSAKSKKLLYLPWDLDLSFAAWPMGGSADEQMNLSLIHPYTGRYKLIDRLLNVPKFRAQYLEIVSQISTTCFSEPELLKRISVVETFLKEPLARELKAVSARGEAGETVQARQIAAGAPALRDFAVRRPRSIELQLAKTSDGYVPGNPFGDQSEAPRPPLPQSLRIKMNELRTTIQKLQTTGKPVPGLEQKLQQFGQLFGAGKFPEAESLLDRILTDFKPME
jgi:spore coat protein H